MHTIEAAYIFALSMMVMLTLTSSTIRLNKQVITETKALLQEEVESHEEGGSKGFRPEDFIRSVTLLEKEKNEEKNEHADK
jgi:hypothetical protein